MTALVRGWVTKAHHSSCSPAARMEDHVWDATERAGSTDRVAWTRKRRRQERKKGRCKYEWEGKWEHWEWWSKEAKELWLFPGELWIVKGKREVSKVQTKRCWEWVGKVKWQKHWEEILKVQMLLRDVPGHRQLSHVQLERKEQKTQTQRPRKDKERETLSSNSNQHRRQT